MNGEKLIQLHECQKCSQIGEVNDKTSCWDERCSGYSRKIYICPKCGCVNTLKYEEDSGLYVNYDERYYK